MKNDSGTAISKSIDGVWKLIFVLVIACLSWQVQAACTYFDGFKDNNDGTVTDPRNGLIWKRCAEGFEWDGKACRGSDKEMNWFNAMQTAKQSRFLGQVDWRIPSKAEFEAVLGKDCKNNDYRSGQYAASSSIAHAVRTNGHPGYFWSFSPYVSQSLNAWSVNFFNGNVSNDSRGNDFQIRLVRASQSLGGKVVLEFNTEYAKIGQYKRESEQEDDKQSNRNQAAAREDERRAKAGNARNQSSEQGLNRIRSREGNTVIGTCASGNDFSAFVDTSNGRWTTAGGRNGMQFASNLDEAVWKVCN
jgi:hypothetical protein